MVYKPLAVRVALVAGFRLALPVFRYMIVVAVAVVMWESPQGFPRGVGRVESRLYGFPCFPYPGISMACFSSAQKLRHWGIARLKHLYSPMRSNPGDLLEGLKEPKLLRPLALSIRLHRAYCAALG
jgi:hypothetical protein